MHVPVTWEPSSRQVWLGDIRPDVTGIKSIRNRHEAFKCLLVFTLVYIAKLNDPCVLKIYTINTC